MWQYYKINFVLHWHKIFFKFCTMVNLQFWLNYILLWSKLRKHTVEKLKTNLMLNLFYRNVSYYERKNEWNVQRHDQNMRKRWNRNARSKAELPHPIQAIEFTAVHCVFEQNFFLYCNAENARGNGKCKRTLIKQLNEFKDPL